MVMVAQRRRAVGAVVPAAQGGSPADINAQFNGWLTTANVEGHPVRDGPAALVVRTSKCRPVDLLEADKAVELPRPPAVLHLGLRNQVRLGRDY